MLFTPSSKFQSFYTNQRSKMNFNLVYYEYKIFLLLNFKNKNYDRAHVLFLGFDYTKFVNRT